MRIVCSSEISGKRQSQRLAKQPVAATGLNKLFSRARKSVYAFPSAAVPVFDHS